MGIWTTLHLFSDTIFYNHTVPSLRGEKEDLTPHYRDCLPGYVTRSNELTEEQKAAMCHTALTDFHALARGFDASFRMHQALGATASYEARIKFVADNPHLENFNRFFQHYVFYASSRIGSL